MDFPNYTLKDRPVKYGARPTQGGHLSGLLRLS